MTAKRPLPLWRKLSLAGFIACLVLIAIGIPRLSEDGPSFWNLVVFISTAAGGILVWLALGARESMD